MPQLAELHPIDWTNGVIVPIIVAVIIGTPLALFAGFIAARYLEFSRIKSAAMHEFIRLGPTLVAACFESYHCALSGALHLFLQSPALEMRATGQVVAAIQITKVAEAIREDYRAAITKENSMILSGLTDQDTRWEAVVVAGKSTLANTQRHFTPLAELKPNLLVLFIGAASDVGSLFRGRLFDEMATKCRELDRAKKREQVL